MDFASNTGVAAQALAETLPFWNDLDETQRSRLAAATRLMRAHAGERIAMTHDKIARHLGSAREVVSRMLKYFEREGLVTLGRGVVDIVDRRGLLALATS